MLESRRRRSQRSVSPPVGIHIHQRWYLSYPYPTHTLLAVSFCRLLLYHGLSLLTDLQPSRRGDDATVEESTLRR